MAMAKGRPAGEGRCSCWCISSPPGGRRGNPRPAPYRPIAKFNAKVMRARLRLRAAMQERRASVLHRGRRARHTPHIHTTLPARSTGSPDKYLPNINYMPPPADDAYHFATFLQFSRDGVLFQNGGGHFRDGICCDHIMCFPKPPSRSDASPRQTIIMQHLFNIDFATLPAFTRSMQGMRSRKSDEVNIANYTYSSRQIKKSWRIQTTKNLMKRL